MSRPNWSILGSSRNPILWGTTALGLLIVVVHSLLPSQHAAFMNGLAAPAAAPAGSRPVIIAGVSGAITPAVAPTPPAVPPSPAPPAPAPAAHAALLPWAFHITSEFGHYPPGWPFYGAAHYGLDLDATYGVVQTAPVSGMVEDVLRGCVEGDKTCGHGWGNHVWWQSAETGHHILLAHFEKLEDWVQIGAMVKAGTPIGVTGATGNAAGPHVHVQVNTDQCCTDLSASNPAWEFPWLRCDPEPILGSRFGGPCP